MNKDTEGYKNTKKIMEQQYDQSYKEALQSLKGLPKAEITRLCRKKQADRNDILKRFDGFKSTKEQMLAAIFESNKIKAFIDVCKYLLKWAV